MAVVSMHSAGASSTTERKCSPIKRKTEAVYVSVSLFLGYHYGKWGKLYYCITDTNRNYCRGLENQEEIAAKHAYTVYRTCLGTDRALKTPF